MPSLRVLQPDLAATVSVPSLTCAVSACVAAGPRRRRLSPLSDLCRFCVCCSRTGRPWGRLRGCWRRHRHGRQASELGLGLGARRGHHHAERREAGRAGAPRAAPAAQSAAGPAAARSLLPGPQEPDPTGLHTYRRVEISFWTELLLPCVWGVVCLCGVVNGLWRG